MKLRTPFLLTLLVALMRAEAAEAEGVLSARFTDPTTRYDHAVLGDDVEYGGIEMTVVNGTVAIRLPVDHVFEDTQPRLSDLDGDEDLEVIVVETDVWRGAALAVYDETGKITETPHIGRSHRWLAPVGAADLDDDGAVEIAYVDRPHLAKTLRVWRYRDGALSEVASIGGLTNHRIGETYISGGIRDCGEATEMITLNADWSRIIATRLEKGRLVKSDLGPFQGGAHLKAFLNCAEGQD